MSQTLQVPKEGALDLVSLGALIHRLDPGSIPFRKATHCQIHVSGGEFNVAANIADCFRLNTGIAPVESSRTSNGAIGSHLPRCR